MDDVYRKAGFDADQTVHVCKLWDKVGNHFGMIPSDFVEQMYMGAEYTTEHAYRKTAGPKDVKTTAAFKAMCEYLEDLLKHKGIGYGK
jgi:hypothetical protein